MPRKTRTPSPTPRSTGKAVPYASLAEGPAPQERLAHFLAQSNNPQAGPMTEEEFDRFLDEVHEVWPDDEEIDRFLDWLHQARREGRYR